MSYYISKQIRDTSFEKTLEQTVAGLKEEGFGILTEIDMQATLKAKLGVDRKPYRILGACNPSFANQALKIENKVGLMLPCNVVVQELDDAIEVSVIDPVAAMSPIANETLSGIAAVVESKLKKVIDKF